MIFGNKFSRKELEVMSLDNASSIEELTERLQALETYLGIEYSGGEYAKIKKTTEKAAKATKSVKTKKA